MIKIKSTLNKNILSGSVLAITNILVLLISFPIYLRYLGAELYGLWVALSVIIAFSQIGDLGITSAITKFVAGEYSNKNNNIKAYITTATLFLMLPSLVIFCISYFFRYHLIELLAIDNKFYSDSILLIPLTGALSILTLYNSLFLGVLMGLQKVSFANYTSLISKLLQVTISITLIFFNYGVWSLFWGVFIGYIFSFVVAYYRLKFHYKITLFSIQSINPKIVKEITYFGGSLVGSKIISLLMDPLNKIVISRYLGLSFVTYYEISLKGALNLRNVFEMGIRAIMPTISSLRSSSRQYIKEVELIYTKSLKLIAFIALPIFIFCFLGAEIILKMWLGGSNSEYIVFGFRVFLIAFYINLLSVPAYYILMGSNNVKFIFRGALIRSITHAIIVFALITLIGSINFDQIIYIHSFSMTLASVYIIYIYHLKWLAISKKAIE